MGGQNIADGAALQLPRVVLQDDVERAYAQLAPAARSAPALTIDLRPATYIDLPALPTMIAIAAARSRSGQTTRFALPDAKRPRDFLALWRFFSALTAATGDALPGLVAPSDMTRLDEPLEAYTHHTRGIDALEFNPAWESGSPGLRNFFEYLSFRLPMAKTARSGAPLTIPRTEAARWQGELVKAVLRTHLSGGQEEQDEVARVILFESLANSVQHPAANVIQIVSRFQRADPYLTKAEQLKLMRREETYATSQEDEGARGTLTLCVWDDGTSIVQTLGAVLKAGGRVRKFKLPTAMYDKFLLETKDLDGKVIGTARPIDSAEDPTQDWPEEAQLLASTFPGVTRRLMESVPPVEDFAVPDDGIERPLGGQFGMGLFTLVRAAVVRYLGSVSLRCGRSLVTIKLSYDGIRKPYGVQYKASAVRFPESAPEFFGNLLTIRLPIRRGKDGDK